MTKNEIYEFLVRLLPVQFEEVVFRAKVPRQFLSSDQVALSTRAIQVAEWAEQSEPNQAALAAALEGLSRTGPAGTSPLIDAPPTPSNAKTPEELLQAARIELPSTFVDLQLASEADLEKWDQVVRWLVDERWRHSTNLFARIADVVQTTNNRYPLRIAGQPGSGKSTLLALLYLTLERRYRDSPASSAIPFFVDLTRYEISGPERLRARLDMLGQTVRSVKNAAAILLVDGVEEYGYGTETLQQGIADFLHQSPEVRKVVAVGLHYDRDLLRNAARLTDDGHPRAAVTLSGVPTTSCRGLLAAYVAVRGREASAEDRLLTLIRQLRLSEVDLLTLGLLESRLPIASSESAATADIVLMPPYDKVRNLTDLFAVYCEQKLGGKQELGRAAALAFRMAMSNHREDPIPPEIGRARRLLHWHATSRNFLVAWHVVTQLRSASLTQEAVDALNYVYPKQTSSFCKDLIGFTKGSEAEFLERAPRHFANAKSKLRSHMAYLVGRVQFHKEWAKQILRDWSRVADETTDAGDPTNHDLLFARTVYISLAYLDEPGAEENYIARMVANKRWNRLNRGFHLEYFGDISWNPRYPEGLMAHEDSGGAWSTTKEALLDRLENERNTLYQIDLFTLVSLAQHRLGTAELGDDDRRRMQKLAEDGIESPRVGSETLRDYLRVMAWQLKSPRFSPVSVLEALYRIKHLPRRGWIKRGIQGTETVGAHSFAAALLASILLPNRPGSEKYSKDTIVRMLLAHDLAECISGDSLPSEDVPAARDREARAYRILASCATHEGIEHLTDCERLFREFTAEVDENARIARDFDRLDNLIQLMLFRNQFADPNTYEEFRRDLSRNIRTPEGQHCRDLVLQYFQNHDELSSWLNDLDAWADKDGRPS